MKEETPAQRRRVLIIGWTILAIIFAAAGVAAVVALWPGVPKAAEPQPAHPVAETP